MGTYGSERVISFSRRVRVVLHICQQKEWIVPRHSVCSDQLLQPTVVPNVSQKSKEQKNKQAVYHDREGKRKIKKKTLLLSKFWLYKVITIFDKISKTIEQ